jgi:U4/U6.U5 tri-snRNP-associated protein 2
MHDGDEASSSTASSTAISRTQIPLKCPYLDTIHRELLDFDLEKVCSVTLASNHVYVCLVCGKYFEGRGKQTPAYLHSLEVSHHLFLNLTNGNVFCLPDMYQVIDASLNDIILAYKPVFTKESIKELSTNSKLYQDFFGVTYSPGFIGLNNLGQSDYINVTIQMLSHIPPLRDFFLLPENYSYCTSPLVRSFGELMRQLWSNARFRAFISPIEFTIQVSISSNMKFTVQKSSDVHEFITWLLNTLHLHLTNLIDVNYQSNDASATASSNKRMKLDAASNKAANKPPVVKKKSIITDIFQGEIEIEVVMSELDDEKYQQELDRRRKLEQEKQLENALRYDDSVDTGGSVVPSSSPLPIITNVRKPPYKLQQHFLFISLQLPPAPLFHQDVSGAVQIPQVSLSKLLSKFDGMTLTESLIGRYHEQKRFRITKLPSYLLIQIKRFEKNSFFVEKNPTIVNFPVRNLDLTPFLKVDRGSNNQMQVDELDLDNISSLSIEQLKQAMNHRKISYVGMTEKSELSHALISHEESIRNQAKAMKTFDLICSVVHDTAASESEKKKAKKANSTSLAASAASVVSKVGIGSSGSGASKSAAGDASAEAPIKGFLEGKYRAHVLKETSTSSNTTSCWHEMEDMVANTIVVPQQVGISEAYLMLYKQRAVE